MEKKKSFTKMGWLSDTYVSNNFASEEIKIIATILGVLLVLVIAQLMFRAYHNHMKTVVKNETNKAVIKQVSLA